MATGEAAPLHSRRAVAQSFGDRHQPLGLDAGVPLEHPRSLQWRRSHQRRIGLHFLKISANGDGLAQVKAIVHDKNRHALQRPTCRRSRLNRRSLRARRGAATLDYVLLLAIVLPMAAFVLWAGPRIMNLVYEMTCVLISWPFM